MLVDALLRGPRWRVRLRSPRAVSVGYALARAAEYLGVATGFLLLPFVPFAASAVARDWSYSRRYAATLGRSPGHLRAILRDRAISRFLVQRLGGAQPATQERIVGACTHCGNCCLSRSCLFLDFDEAGRSSCRIYGTSFWNSLSCSLYPANSRDIELYRCPSFSTVPEPEPRRRPVIPLRVVETLSPERD
jgi:hypothetical protein